MSEYDEEWFLPLAVGLPLVPRDPWTSFLKMWNDIGIRVAIAWLHEDMSKAIFEAFKEAVQSTPKIFWTGTV